MYNTIHSLHVEQRLQTNRTEKKRDIKKLVNLELLTKIYCRLLLFAFRQMRVDTLIDRI